MVSAIVPNTAGAVFLVTGANRGLGLEHVRQFLRKSQVQVVATARHPGKATHLKGLLDQYKERLAVVELDTGDEASIEAAAKKVEQLHPAGVDLVLNNAAMQEPVARGSEASGEDHLQVYRVNTVGPYLVTKYFLPQMKKKPTRVVINTSSIVGSIAFNASGGYKGLWLPYTSSKAALNMQTAVLGYDLRDEGFTFVALQPGYVSTDLGTAMTPHLGMAPPLDPPTSVASQHNVIFGLTRSNNGQFLDQEGNVAEY